MTRQLLADRGAGIWGGPWGWMDECGDFTNLQVLGLVVNGHSGTSVIKEYQN